MAYGQSQPSGLTKPRPLLEWKPSPAPLATGLLAGPLQAVLHNAFDLLWQLSGVHDEYRSVCRCQPTLSWSPVSTFH